MAQQNKSNQNKTAKQSDITELIDQIVTFRDERGWKEYHTPKSMALGILIEAGELAEYFHYLEGEELKRYINTFHSEIADEMADVLYWVLLMSHELEIDIVKAFKEKMKKNALKYPPKKGVGKAFTRLAKKQASKT